MRLLGIALSLALVAPAAATLAPSPAAARRRRPPAHGARRQRRPRRRRPRPRAGGRRGDARARRTTPGHRPRPPVGRAADRQRPAAGHRSATGATLSVWKDGTTRRTWTSRRDPVWVSGETGLMGLAVDPDFAEQPPLLHLPGRQHRGGGHDVRVIAWTLDDAATQRDAGSRTLVGGFPDQRPARRLPAADRPRRLAAGRHRRRRRAAPTPRTSTSLGGKTLRLDRFTGAPWPSNPFVNAAEPRQALRPHLRPPQRPGPGPARRRHACGRSSRAPTATTRSTCSSTAATTATTRCPATTRRSR